MTREFIDDCSMWASKFSRAAVEIGEEMFDDRDADGTLRHMKALRIDFGSGFKILALSSRPRSVRGKQGLVIIDEAAFHDDLPDLLKAVMAMLIWGGRVRILSSHDGEDNAFNQLVKDIRAGKFPQYSLHRTAFGDALDAGLYERVRLVQGARMKAQTREAWRDSIRAQYGEGAAEELDCIPSMSSGTYFPRTLIERCQTDGCVVLRWAKPPEFMLDDTRLAQCDVWVTLPNMSIVITSAPCL